MINRLRSRLFRWRHILVALVTVMAPALLCILGVLWLWEKQLLIEFALICLLLSALAWIARFFLGRSSTSLSPSEEADLLDVEPNPEWSQTERETFFAVCETIQDKTQDIMPWAELPQLSLVVIQDVANRIGGEKRKPLDFSGPEGLLLIEQTAARYREHLRKKLPFADQISVGSIYWLWKKRKNISTAWKIADGGRRLARFATNPTMGAIREIEALIAGGNTHYFSDHMLSTLQTILLEEVASAAIDLYSGRLRFSDSELMAIELQSTRRDKKITAQPDSPLRLVIVGQVSTGKSTLLNHLINADQAETDVAPTTDKSTNYISQLIGTACHVIDTPGIDGSADNRTQLIAELKQSDLVIWLLRADRPSRAADKALLEGFASWCESHPTQRKPVMLFALTFIDRLIDAWPYPEHDLPENVQQTIDGITTKVAEDLHINKPIPVSNEFPAWNIMSLIELIEEHQLEAAMVQKNRKRTEGAVKNRSIIGNAQRGASGVYHGVKTLGGKWLDKNKFKSPGQSDK